MLLIASLFIAFLFLHTQTTRLTDFYIQIKALNLEVEQNADSINLLKEEAGNFAKKDEIELTVKLMRNDQCIYTDSKMN